MTERTVVKQSMVDDDAISLTSTVVSEYGSDQEFSVDKILAEKTEGKKRKYLILWENYPLEKATWEPHKNINDEILEAWKERKSRESKGLDEPFNVAKFGALLARLAAEKADRRRRRKSKRKRLGRTVSPSPSEADDSDSSVEAVEDNEVEEVKPGTKRKSKSPPKKPAKALKPLSGRRESTSSVTSLETARMAPEKKASSMLRQSTENPQSPSRQASEASRHSRTLSQSSSDTPHSRKRPLQRTSLDRPGSSSSDGPLVLKRPKPTAAPPPAADVWKLTSAKKSSSSTEPATLAGGLPPIRGTSTAARGRVATRGGGNVAHKNVFQAREPPKKRGNLLQNAMTAKAPKKFSNMRLARKAELQARDLAESAPDISALGGLFDPSRPDSMVPIRPENLRRTSSNFLPLDEEPNPLFVNSRDNSPVASDPWRTASHLPQPPEAPPAYRGMSICYYWDKQQKVSNQPPCQMGTACRFLHRYAPGVPIAPAPKSAGVDPRRTNTGGSDDAWDNPQTAHVERKLPAGPPQSTCFFWDKGMKDKNESGCSRGDGCTYQHRYEEGMPIAPPPPGHMGDIRRPNTPDDGKGTQWRPQAPPLERDLPAPPPGYTCFFWDRSRKLRSEPECSRGGACSYQHYYQEGMPIAPPPPGWVGNDIRVPVQAPSTEDFPPWTETSSENHSQDTVPLPAWRRSSGDVSQASPAQEDVSQQMPDLNAVLQDLRTTTNSPRNSTQRPRQEYPLKESLPVAASRPDWDVYNPTHAICYFWFNQEGNCSKGWKCKYSHENLPSLPLAPSFAQQQDIFANTACRDWERGNCRYTAQTCRYLHHHVEPRERKIDENLYENPRVIPGERSSSRQASGVRLESTNKAVSDPQTTSGTSSNSNGGPAAKYFQHMASAAPKIGARPPWNPLKPSNSICYFWHTTGNCTNGSTCTYSHSDNPSLPIAPNPKEHASLRSAALREQASKRYSSEAYSSEIPSREDPRRREVYEARYDHWSPNREESSSPRQPPTSRVASVRQAADKAAVEGQIATDRPKNSTQKLSARSPLLTTTSTPPQMKPRPAWNSRDPLNAICFFLATTGACPEERECQYIHSNDPNLAVAPSPSEIPGRPAWDARNPLNAICYFLASTGSCSRGPRCKFLHSNDPTLPIAPSPALREMRGPPEYDDRGRQTCKYWLSDDCAYNDTCPFWHGPLSAKVQYDQAVIDSAREQVTSTAKPTPTGPRVKFVSFAVDQEIPLVEEPESMVPSNQKSRPQASVNNAGGKARIICYHWQRGDCHHGAKCWFSHEYPPVEGSNQISRDVEMQERIEKHPQVTARRSEGSKDIEMQDEVQRQQFQIPVGQNESSRDIEMKDADEVARTAIPRKSVTFDPMTNARSLAMSEKELPAATVESNIVAQPRIIKTLNVSSELPTPSSENPVLAPRIKQKPKMDEYRQKKTLKELGAGAKEVTFGLYETQSLILDFGDMNQALELPWGLLFSRVTKVRFDQMCIAQDFQAQQGSVQRLRLWHGNLLAADAGDADAIKSIDKAADELVRRSAGLFSSFPNFLVLVFPAKKDEWKFLESTLDYPHDVRLRYFIFQSNVDIKQCLKMNPTSLAIGASYRDILVDRVHRLDIKRLLPVIKKSRPSNIYLLFPSTASPTADFIISWLTSSNRNCKIYSSQSEGSWHYFTHTPEIDSGIILVHESAAAELHRLPNLYSMAVEKTFTFWYLSESSSPYPLFPSTSYGFDDSTMGQLSAIRLFPHGCAFLLTPSLLVAEPHSVYQILDWFIVGGVKLKPKYLISTPRTWKLVCCHDFIGYALEVAISKAAEKDAFELKHRDDPAKDAKLHDAGLSFNECNLRWKIHKMLVAFESRRSLESISEWDSDCDESDYPFVHASKHIDPDNENALIDWYAGWTMRNLDIYKKFVVVGSSEPKHRERLTRVKEVKIVKKKEHIEETESLRPPITNVRNFSTTKKSSASPMESPRSPLSAQKQRALAVAAKLSASPGNKIANSRDQDRNPFDDIAMRAASSPTRQNVQSSALSKAHSHSEMQKTGDRINLNEQINRLIAESTETLPHLNTADAGKSHTNGSGSANPTPVSSSTNRSKDLHPPFDGVDDQAAGMDPDLSMLGFDGAEDDRPTSSSSNNSRSGIQSDENGRRYVPRSVRPDASIRKEIPVRPGYVPPEDGEFYQIPSRRESAAGTPTGQNQSAVGSPAAGASYVDSDGERTKEKSRWMPTESVQSQSEREYGEVEEVVKKMEVVKFEATTTWYRKEVKEGRGWEHIRVEGFEGAVKLGIGK